MVHNIHSDYFDILFWAVIGTLNYVPILFNGFSTSIHTGSRINIHPVTQLCDSIGLIFLALYKIWFEHF